MYKIWIVFLKCANGRIDSDILVRKIGTFYDMFEKISDDRFRLPSSPK